MDNMFKHHIIRDSLLQIWNRQVNLIPQKRPLWIVPQEVIQFVAGSKEAEPHTYGDLVKFENKQSILMKEEELEKKINWWFYIQIKDLFNKDIKQYGIRKDNSELETILIEEEHKVISKIYKILLKWDTINELVKEQMTKWAINVNSEIMFDQWEYL